MEDTILYQDVLARLGVAAVSIWAFVVYVDLTHGNVLGEQWMHDPEWGVEHCHPLDKDILTVDGIDELHTQPLAHAEHAVLNRDIVLTHLLEYGSVAEAVAIPWET